MVVVGLNSQGLLLRQSETTKVYKTNNQQSVVCFDQRMGAQHTIHWSKKKLSTRERRAEHLFAGRNTQQQST